MKPLTPKQSRFCELVAGGISGSEAYRNAYAAGGMNDASIRQEAHRLSRLPHIAEAVTRLREQDSEMVHATEKVRSDWIIERLMDEASNFKNPASSRVRALEILGKANGLFENVQHIRVHRSPEEIEQDLLQKLGALNLPLFS